MLEVQHLQYEIIWGANCVQVTRLREYNLRPTPQVTPVMGVFKSLEQETLCDCSVYCLWCWPFICKKPHSLFFFLNTFCSRCHATTSFRQLVPKNSSSSFSFESVEVKQQWNKICFSTLCIVILVPQFIKSLFAGLGVCRWKKPAMMVKQRYRANGWPFLFLSSGNHYSLVRQCNQFPLVDH